MAEQRCRLSQFDFEEGRSCSCTHSRFICSTGTHDQVRGPDNVLDHNVLELVQNALQLFVIFSIFDSLCQCISKVVYAVEVPGLESNRVGLDLLADIVHDATQADLVVLVNETFKIVHGLCWCDLAEPDFSAFQLESSSETPDLTFGRLK